MIEDNTRQIKLWVRTNSPMVVHDEILHGVEQGMDLRSVIAMFLFVASASFRPESSARPSTLKTSQMRPA